MQPSGLWVVAGVNVIMYLDFYNFGANPAPQRENTDLVSTKNLDIPMTLVHFYSLDIYQC